ncbi:hypothetical protein Ancab_038638 [Ancistrocladus abbreviatus]
MANFDDDENPQTLNEHSENDKMPYGSNLPPYGTSELESETSPSGVHVPKEEHPHHQPLWTMSMQDDSYFSYQNLFTEENSKLGLVAQQEGGLKVPQGRLTGVSYKQALLGSRSTCHITGSPEPSLRKGSGKGTMEFFSSSADKDWLQNCYVGQTFAVEQWVDISVFAESSGETIFSRGMDRMRMLEADGLRHSSGNSAIHSSCQRRVSPGQGNIRLDSLSSDLPSTGPEWFRVLTKERAHDDGLAGVYTLKTSISWKGLIDGEGVADMGCINEFANVVGSRSKSDSRAKGPKLRPARSESRVAEDSSRERGLGVDHQCSQSGELGLIQGSSAPSVGLGLISCSADSSQCPSRPKGDKVLYPQKPDSLSSHSVHIHGPSKAVKGRPRLSVVQMGRFKIGVKKNSKKQRKDRVSRSTDEVRLSIDDSGSPDGQLSVWARHIVRVNSVYPEAASWLSTGFRKVLGNGEDTLFWFDAWSRRVWLLLRVVSSKIKDFGMTIVGSGAPNGEDPFTSATRTDCSFFSMSYKRSSFSQMFLTLGFGLIPVMVPIPPNFQICLFSSVQRGCELAYQYSSCDLESVDSY